MTVKGLQGNSKPSLFSLDVASISNGSPNNGSPSRDVNLNHLKIVKPAQKLPSHNQGFLEGSSPTREVPLSPTQKVHHLKEKKDDRYVIEPTIEKTKSDELVMEGHEEVSERPIKDVSSSPRLSSTRINSLIFQIRESEIIEESVNGRTAISIPGDLPSSKSKSPPIVEKRHSQRSDSKDSRDNHRNSAKLSNHHNNNNSKVNSACLNNLILPLLSDVS